MEQPSGIVPGAVATVQGGESPSIQVNPLAIMAWFNAIAMLILAMPALSAIVLLRRNFGCRFLKLWMIAIDFLALWTLFSFSGRTILGVTGREAALGITPARVFAVVMASAAVWQSRTAWARFWGMGFDPALTTHSTYEGDSRLAVFFPKISHRILTQVIEPGVVVAAAFLCLLILSYAVSGFSSLGVWLLFSGVFLALYEAIMYEFRLHKFIDLIDQNIEVQMTSKVQNLHKEGRRDITPQEVAGAPVVLDSRMFAVMEASRRARTKPE